MTSPRPAITRLNHSALCILRLPRIILLPILLVLGAGPARPAPNSQELFDWARPKVVLIQIQTGSVPRWGTGFIAARGRVLTNEHVVRNARAVIVWANGAPYRARVAAVDAPQDLAALVLPDAALELKPLNLGSNGRAKHGEPVLILASRTQMVRRSRASPAGRLARVSPVPGTAWDYSWLHWSNGPPSAGLRLQARAVPGDSGSPVLRVSDGAVIGILRGRTYPDGDGRSETAWAVPIEVAHALLARVTDPVPPAEGPGRYYLEALSGQ